MTGQTWKKTRMELPSPLEEVLPSELTERVLACGAESIEEIRLHTGREATVTSCGKNFSTGVILEDGETEEILTRLCNSSLYACEESIKQGYVTLAGGVRVGICGEAAVEKGKILGVKKISGLVIRIPHSHTADVSVITSLLTEQKSRGILLFAPPGGGKTTVLRAVAEAAASSGFRTVAVDSRAELTGTLKGTGLTLDCLAGYPKEIGIEIAVRSLGADLILCDEIGSLAEAAALSASANAGVALVATAHAKDVGELLRRPSIARLHRARVFDHYAGIVRDGFFRFSFTVTDWAMAEGQKQMEETAF